MLLNTPWGPLATDKRNLEVKRSFFVTCNSQILLCRRKWKNKIENVFLFRADNTLKLLLTRGAGKAVQWLKPLALIEDPNSIPNTNIRQLTTGKLTTACTPRQSTSWPLWAPVLMCKYPKPHNTYKFISKSNKIQPEKKIVYWTTNKNLQFTENVTKYHLTF